VVKKHQKKSYEELEREVNLLRQEASELRKKNARLERSNELLREKVKNQAKRIKELEALTEKQAVVIEEQGEMIKELKYQVEQLREMVFGKGKGKKKEKEERKEKQGKRKKAKRAAASYRRAEPKAEEVTETKVFAVDKCPDCGTRLTIKKVIEQYLEDLSPLELFNKALKVVRKEVIEEGYCSKCKKKVSGGKIKPQKVSLGEQVKRFIVYAVVVLRLSYSQVQTMLWDVSKLKISDGEISKTLFAQADQLEPHVEEMKLRIQNEAAQHYDETTWKVAGGEQGNYAWVMTAVEGKDTIFLFGRSRGKGNMEELRGEPVRTGGTVGITDDYGAYRSAFVHHQLCWAHPYRKLRDIAQSEELPKQERHRCKIIYNRFGRLYSRLRKLLDQEVTEEKRKKEYDYFHDKWQKITAQHPNDPPRLLKIKERLAKNEQKYLTCLCIPGIPCDNNKAERSLRHVVIKRRICQGSKSEAAAEMMGILCSATLSLWWQKPENFFASYSQLLSAS